MSLKLGLLDFLGLLGANGGSQMHVWEAFWCPHGFILIDFVEVWVFKTFIFNIF